MKILFILITALTTLATPPCELEGKKNMIRTILIDEANGILRFDSSYSDISSEYGNECGNATIYMIHKDGWKKWLEWANKEYADIVNGKNYGYEHAAEKLSENYEMTNDYNKLCFYTDKAYLTPVYDGESDDITISKGFESSKYPQTIILYSKKWGETKWTEIDRKTFASEEEKLKSTWEVDHIKKLL
ncbi:hypothetical protein FLLO111716_00825 [Flavobacterium longum]|uniref:hypothetical protein n=1 Tax=Flavobacterium longum TaxID=1299340 RepID=UPI0039EBC38D